MAGRRPADGSFPACPTSGICKAQSVRTHEACRNCALTSVSLASLISKRGTDAEIYQQIKRDCPVCLDLLARLVDARHTTHASQDAPPFAELALDIYHAFGNGNISQRYLGNALKAPRPGDEAHARMILEELGLTCYAFNPESDKCHYIEDYIYCKRHTPILTVQKLHQMCAKYEQQHGRHSRHPSHLPNPNHNRKRKHVDSSAIASIASVSIANIKNSILEHEAQIKRAQRLTKYKELGLRKRFNAWLRKITS